MAYYDQTGNYQYQPSSSLPSIPLTISANNGSNIAPIMHNPAMSSSYYSSSYPAPMPLPPFSAAPYLPRVPLSNDNHSSLQLPQYPPLTVENEQRGHVGAFAQRSEVNLVTHSKPVPQPNQSALPPAGYGSGWPSGSDDRALTSLSTTATADSRKSSTTPAAVGNTGNGGAVGSIGNAKKSSKRGRPPTKRRRKRKVDSEDDMGSSSKDEDEDMFDDRNVSNENLPATGGAEDASGDETSSTFVPITTKSGRAVHRPTQFATSSSSATAPSPSGRRKSGSASNPRAAAMTGAVGRPVGRPSLKPAVLETIVCRGCERGHSPEGNAIVFCDGCTAPWHQYCHDPPIAREVVEIVDKEWACSQCDRATAQKSWLALDGLGGLRLEKNDGTMDNNQKRSRLHILDKNQLVEALVQISSVYPNIAMFPTRYYVDQRGSVSATVKEETFNQDAYDGYETDPPAHYPKPNQGLANLLPQDVHKLYDNKGHHQPFQHVLFPDNYQGSQVGQGGEIGWNRGGMQG